MNPIRFIIFISGLCLTNFILIATFCFWALLMGYSTFNEFLEYLLLITAYPTILLGLYFGFFGPRKDRNFDHIQKRLNLAYVIPVTILVTLANLAFDFGIYADIANVGFVSAIAIKFYFVIYETCAGLGIGTLLSELFEYAEYLDK